MQQINRAAKRKLDKCILTDRSTSRGMLFPYRNPKLAQDRQGGWFRNVKRRSAAVQQSEGLRPLSGGGQAS